MFGLRIRGRGWVQVLVNFSGFSVSRGLFVGVEGLDVWV